MDSAFETRTLALTFDLLTDQLPTSIGNAAEIIWKDVLTSKKFHSEVTQRIINALKQEYGLISQDFYNDNKKEIQSIMSKSAGKYAVDSSAGAQLKDLGSSLEKSLEEIENHFNHSKAGIWIDEASKSVTVIVSVLAIAGYGIYSFRNTKAMQNIVNKANLIGLTSKSFHIGGIKLTGEVSNYSASKSTVELSASATGKWQSIQLKAKSNGIVNFNTGQILESSANLKMTYPINESLQLNSGLRSSTQEENNNIFENSAYLEVNLTNGSNNLSLRCSITDKNNSSANKECSVNANINF